MDNLFKFGDFPLNSGKKSFFKIECDALTDDDWKCLAEMVRRMVGLFSSVEGIPRGGLRLAEYLKPFAIGSGPHLIVDDVFTTGGSMARAWDAKYKADGSPRWIRPGEYILGAVVFARGKCPPWIQPVFQLPTELWLPAETTSV